MAHLKNDDIGEQMNDTSIALSVQQPTLRASKTLEPLLRRGD